MTQIRATLSFAAKLAEKGMIAGERHEKSRLNFFNYLIFFNVLKLEERATQC